jgi:pantoate--beta-alanine ligase
MHILQTPDELKIWQKQRQSSPLTLIPTMGNLHAGHMRLIEIAKTLAHPIIISIFVNPTQFGPTEDCAQYPRTLEADLKKLDRAGVCAVFTPSVHDLYPYGEVQACRIQMGDLGTVLCGKTRPLFFSGVATIVLRLFHLVKPHSAIFGEKDFQQLKVIQRLIAEFFIPVEIISAPTLRESDGLAMSSRNQYLTPAERAIAPKLYQTLEITRQQLRTHDPNDQNNVLKEAQHRLITAGFQIDYLSLCHIDTLKPIDGIENAILLAACILGKTRLIDNIRI